MATFRSRPHGTAARLAVLAAAGALVLTACGGDDAEPQATGTASLANSEIKLYVPTAESGDSPYKVIAAAYTAEFPDRKVTITEASGDAFGQGLTTQLRGGNAADVFYVTPGRGNPVSLLPLIEAGYLAPLESAATKAAIPESSLQNFESDGKVYAHALDLTIVSTVTNKTAADSLGYGEPADFAALLDTCKAVAAKGATAFVLAGTTPQNNGLAAMVLAGSRVYAENPTWNLDRTEGKTTFAETQGWVDTLQAFIDMKDAGCFQAGVEGAGFDAITQGLAQGKSVNAFVPAGAAFGIGQEAPTQTFVVTQMPGATADATTMFVSANNALAVNAKSANLAAAKAFVEWLAIPANLAKYVETSGNLTAGTIDATKLPPQYAPVADALAEGSFIPLPNQGWASGEVYDNLGKGVQGLLTGQATVEQVLKSMDDAWDAAS